ncbi:hypothetical protein BDU57DRAFT_515747 [Ampelomyces quisqualis]|uniref:BTB domain-containing protein n=1 Tax=Ampelomyces quisqualis TaxID=50730 RepID=A0A6A5QKP4_AMPQU|nr:hypothetical protein BDU57DRAFT_515747 [Ampelomyces quisqualis]
MAEAARQRVLDSIKSLRETDDYSDLVITCGTCSYSVHKAIVCKRADFFARAVKFGGKEASEGKINLPEDEPAIVNLLMQYLYEGEYEPLLPDKALAAKVSYNKTAQLEIIKTASYDTYGNTYTYDFPHACHSSPTKKWRCIAKFLCPHHTCNQDCSGFCRDFVCTKCTRIHSTLEGAADQLLLHAKMYEIADKYDVVGLKELVQEKFKRACKTFWDDHSFAAAANHTFSTTVAEDKGLRDIVSSTISEHVELMQKAEIQALMMEHNGLALGILMHKMAC